MRVGWGGSRPPTAPSAGGGFHLDPHYREQTPLDAAFLRTKPGFDDFITEKYHDQIAATLEEWSEGLRESPRHLQAIEKALAAVFEGTSARPAESLLIRPGAALEVRRIVFPSPASPDAAAFLEDFRSALSVFSSIVTAEFQVTGIDALPDRLRTRVRYELVGTGQGFHREQRVGFWDLEWEAAATGEYRVRVWRMEGETRSRSAEPCYADVTRAAFGANASYSGQLLHGTDYWRTVLDGACGIDIYGHHGVSVGDVDGDGFDDLYVCQPAGLPNRLYRNRGDGTFEDITGDSGVGILENTACALFIDVDNDGRQDLVVVRSNGPLLFLNEGGGKFRLKPDAFQFASPPQGTFTGAAAADYDRDGWLDIYFCLYVYYQGTDQYKYPVPYYDAENGPPNFFVRNNRDGTFRDVTAQTGRDKNNTRYSFCCGWNDYNGDGWPDLYVVNDFGRKNLYRNNGDGTFTDVAPEAGVEDVGAGMSVSWLDYDNDGAPDLYSADMWTAAGERISMQENFKNSSPESVRALYQKHAMGNCLFRNRGNGAFQDATATSGVGMGRWAWSSDAWDFDHDGFPDIYVANGMLSGPVREDLNSFFWRQVVANSPDEARASHDYEQGWNAINELIRADYTWSGYERNVFYANNRDGTFSDVSGALGLDFLEDGRAFALADFDHDGRQEVFLKNRNAPQLRLLRNVMEELPPAIAIRLRGHKSNRDAIGAAITVETESGRQTRMLQAGSGFLSQHSKEMFFGLGTSRGPANLTIRWPDGLVQKLEGIPPNHRVWVEEGLESHRVEPFRARSPFAAGPQESETLPATAETWLLAPVRAPDFSLPDASGRVWTLSSLRGKPVLLSFVATRPEGGEDKSVATRGLQRIVVSFDEGAASATVSACPVLRGSDDVAGVYNILYRRLFDRHRDLGLPASFLIDANGDIVKVYQGGVNLEHADRDFRHIPQNNAERLDKALPFAGIADTYEFGRNYLSYGSAFFQRGYFDQAESFFRLALRDDPSSAEALYGLGSVYLKLERAGEARDNFERAAKLSASYPETTPNAFNNLGLLAARAGRTDEAISNFQEALRASPGHFVALENLGNAYRQQKRWEEARKTLERAIAVGPGDPEANYSLGMVFAQTGDTERAYQYLRKALELRPAYPEALNNLGVLYLRTGRRDQAVAAFEECIRVAPGFDQSYLNLARVHNLEGHPQEARNLLVELLKQRPGDVEAQRELEQMR
jgi:tetratricopeptide (TPR) repeat protein